MPKKGDRSNPSNYRPIALLSCLSKAFESILNRKIQKHLSTSDLLSDRQYGFRKGRSTGDLLAFLTDSWSSSLSRFGETFAIALDISKAFDRVWHKSLLSKLPSYGFYPSLCTFISSFLSDRSISAVVDGHCSSPKPINSGVPQGSVLSPTLCGGRSLLLFIDDLLSIERNCPIHSYADDSTLHYSTSFNRRPTLQELNDSRLEAAERLASDLTIISDWGKKNLVSFNASKTQFLHLSTRHNLPNNYPLFFDNTQLSPSSTLNILGLSLTQNLNWKLHISSLTKSASSRLGVLYRLRQFFSPAQLLSIYRGLVRPRMEYASHVWGGSTHTALLDRVEAKALRLISSPPHTDSLLPLKFRRNVASLSIFYRYFHADCSSELANCMPPPLPRPRCTRLSTHAHPYTVQTPYARVNQHLHSFIPHAGKLWNNLPSSVFPPACSGAVSSGPFFFFFIKPLNCLRSCKKKKMVSRFRDIHFILALPFSFLRHHHHHQYHQLPFFYVYQNLYNLPQTVTNVCGFSSLSSSPSSSSSFLILLYFPSIASLSLLITDHFIFFTFIPPVYFCFPSSSLYSFLTASSLPAFVFLTRYHVTLFRLVLNIFFLLLPLLYFFLPCRGFPLLQIKLFLPRLIFICLFSFLAIQLFVPSFFSRFTLVFPSIDLTFPSLFLGLCSPLALVIVYVYSSFLLLPFNRLFYLSSLPFSFNFRFFMTLFYNQSFYLPPTLFLSFFFKEHTLSCQKCDTLSNLLKTMIYKKQ